MLQSTLLFAFTGLAAASTYYNSVKGVQKNLLLPGANSQALGLSLSGCDVGQVSCDTGCMPSNGECCGIGNGAYCDSGDYCVSNGCCEDGEICSGAPSGCDDGKEECGSFCIPEGSVCCDTGYCDAGDSCTSDGLCSPGGGDGGSGGGGGNNCYSFQEECGTGCMPEGSVCCDNGQYCFSGETCLSDGTCQFGSSGGDDDSTTFTFTDSEPSFTDSEPSFTDSGPSFTDSDIPSFTEPSFTEPSFSAPSLTVPSFTNTFPTLTDSPSPTGLRSGGDDSGGDSNSDKPDAAAANVPSILVGLLALVPLLL
ncbi:Fc.00g061060.m01.CDS01 [Cosmosporella sp. VM-42]